MTEDTGRTAGAAAAALARLMIGNGIDATTGEYLLPPIDVHQLAQLATGVRLDAPELSELQSKTRRARQANFAVVEGVEANDLAQAGWAVVFAAVDAGSQAAARRWASSGASASRIAA
jgi:hypothetical protein